MACETSDFELRVVYTVDRPPKLQYRKQTLDYCYEEAGCVYSWGFWEDVPTVFVEEHEY